MQRLTRNQLREIDRRSAADFHLPTIVLMENAARGAADVALSMLPDHPAAVCILCGGGNNGGDGLAIARHLHNAGHRVIISLAIDPAKFTGDALTNWQICQAMKLPTAAYDPSHVTGMALLIDAIFGTGLDQPPRDPFGKIAQDIAASGAAVLAIDVPSGLDCDTGLPMGSAIRATKTVTFVSEKTGFANAQSRPFTGEIIVKPIGCPVELIAAVTT